MKRIIVIILMVLAFLGLTFGVCGCGKSKAETDRIFELERDSIVLYYKYQEDSINVKFLNTKKP